MGSNKMPVLMEVNPRFWGSLNQAIQSGVNFPCLLYQMATEGDISTVYNYTIGIKTKNILMDYISISRHIFSGDIMKMCDLFSLPYGDDVLSRDDPYPIIYFIRDGVNELIHNRDGR